MGSSGGGGGGEEGDKNINVTTSSSYPEYALPLAKSFLETYGNLALPGGDIADSHLPYSEVAPLTEPQLQGLQAIGALGQYAPSVTAAQGLATDTIEGKYLAPNKYLNDYYNNAADSLIRNYKYATDPSLLTQGAKTGTLVSSGLVQGSQLAQYDLGQNLANLAAGIYEPAYQYERGAQNTAAAQTPALTEAEYIPAQQLLQGGALEQQQMQNILDQAYSNLQALGLWPYQDLNYLAGAFGPATGGGGTSTQNQAITSTADSGSIK